MMQPEDIHSGNEGGESVVELHEQPYQDFGGATEETGILTGRRSQQRVPQESGWLRTCLCCCPSSRVGSTRRRSEWTLSNVMAIINFVFLIAMSIAAYFAYQNMQQQIQGMRKEVLVLKLRSDERMNDIAHNVTLLQNEEDKYETETAHTLSEYGETFKDVYHTLEYHQYQLTRLSNGTSNADVLDKLAETREEVARHLEKEHQEVYTVLEQSDRNLTQRLQQNYAEMSATRKHVEQSLNKTVSYMQEVVGVASVYIQSVQKNVTTEIDGMTANVQTIVRKLGDKVKDAEKTIHEEVQAVQDNIAQYVAVTDKQFAAENDFVKYQLAGTFTLLACLISLWHLTAHLRHYYKPDVQRRIMAVLWMVPIYSITSWLSLVWPQLEPFLNAVRDCYEAYAIYTFIGLLIAIIEDGRGLNGMIHHLSKRVVEERDAVTEYERLVAERAPTWSFLMFGTSWTSSGAPDPTRLPPRPVEHIVPPFPCCYRVQRPVTVAAAWLYQCQLMAVQFVILRPLLTIVPLLLKQAGLVDLTSAPVLINGTSINWYAPNLYILFITNVSVAIAFYGLLSFYHGTEKDLEWCDPWPKFLCIKGVVFCTFWQQLTIQFLSGAGRMDDHSASQIQNLLICIEMFLAAIAHFYIFPHEEWKDGYKREKEKGIMLRDTLALRDFVKDMSLMVTSWNTDADMEALLQEEKSKLSNELHNLASMSHHGSGSRRGSHSHSGSAHGDSHPSSPTSSGLLAGGSSGYGDIERGIGYQSSILNFPSFSFDLAGAEHLHRSDSRSAAVVASGPERERLVAYRSQQLAMRGMRRQVSSEVSHTEQFAASAAPNTGANYGAIPPGIPSRSTSVHLPSQRPGFDRSESLRNALLSKLQALAPDGSPLPGSDSRSSKGGGSEGASLKHQLSSVPEEAGSRGVWSTYTVSEEVWAECEGEGSDEERADFGGYGSRGAGGVGGAGGAFSDAHMAAAGDTPDTPYASSEGAGAAAAADNNRSFRRGRNDSLTYSPDASRQSLLLGANAAHSQSDLLGGRILFPGGEGEGEGADLQLEGAVAVDEDIGDVSSLESESEDAGVKPPLRRLNRSGLLSTEAVAHSVAEGPTSRMASTAPVGESLGADAAAELSPMNPLATASGRASIGTVPSAFHDVLTPPPEQSPLPQLGRGTWTAVKGAGLHEDEDSDHSTYAV